MIEPKNFEPCFNCGIIDKYCQKKITEELEKIKTEIMGIGNWREINEVPNGYVVECLNIVDKHISDMKENKE